MKKLYKDISKGKSYFYYYGWTILVFIVSFFLMFFFIFQAMFYVKRTERIELFIAAHGLKDDGYHTVVEKTFKDKGLIEMNIYSYIENDQNIYNYFSANGENADYIIFSETNVKDLQDYVLDNYFNINKLSEDVPSITKFDTYSYEDTPVGIKIYDGKDASYNEKYKFSNIIEFSEESYYLLIDSGSPNFDKDKGHTLGYSVLEYLLDDMLVK